VCKIDEWTFEHSNRTRVSFAVGFDEVVSRYKRQIDNMYLLPK